MLAFFVLVAPWGGWFPFLIASWSLALAGAVGLVVRNIFFEQSDEASPGSPTAAARATLPGLFGSRFQVRRARGEGTQRVSVGVPPPPTIPTQAFA